MKKIVCALLALLMMAALAACGTDSQKEIDKPKTAATAATEPTARPSKAIDVDLTKLSSTMVYAEVYNMMMNPAHYMGKTVKMNGLFSVYHDEVTDKYYYACVIVDATSCCSQGLEFELTGEHSYPRDYPELGTEITVVGEFSTYLEENQQYCCLINAEME